MTPPMRFAMVRIAGLLAALCVLAMNGAEAWAAATTAKMAVSATVVNACALSTTAIVVGSNMLGPVGPVVSGPVSVHCGNEAASARSAA